MSCSKQASMRLLWKTNSRAPERKRVACSVRDDQGGERAVVMEVEVK